MRILEVICLECETDYDLTNEMIDKLQYRVYTTMKMERDTTLDNL